MTSGQRSYQICTYCIMDTSDPNIQFDANGVCNHCRAYDALVRAVIPPAEQREARLKQQILQIQRAGSGRDYDCIIGVSGGVDSTYVAYMTKQLGLRPLAVHMDNGWNSTQAVTNIERLLRNLDLDLYTEVLDWEEFRDLQLAFLRASTPHSEVPTDHAIAAVLMRVALQHGVRYIISGSNVVNEAIMPSAWTSGIRDWKYIKSIHARFGSIPLRSFPHFRLLDFVAYGAVHRQKTIPLLNYLDYVKCEAMQVLRRELGWEYYGGKHYESVYTRFFQAYILPHKFGIDKRRAHLSTLICAGHASRHAALAEIEQPMCDALLLRQDREFVIKKLGITEDDFERIMALPPKNFADYPSYERGQLFRVMRWLYRLPRAVRGYRLGSDFAGVGGTSAPAGEAATT